ncbi:MAG TPA: SDR family NAD(P)-dependent oxidoreductase [Solirubrobacterales bacterium]
MAKTVFITGASSGIGRALAAELAGRGYDLALAARRVQVLEELRAELAERHEGREISVRALDVTDVADVAAAIEEAAEKHGGLDIVIANAGVGSTGPVGEGRIERDRVVIETNVIGAIATVDAAVALFRRQGYGQIVGITSVAGYRGLPTSASYSASKAALSTYLDSVRVETHRDPITVTALAPGYIDTPINQDMPSRPFLISVEDGAAIAANLIERGVGHSTIPRMPWTLVRPLLKVVPNALLARAMPKRGPRSD